MSEQDDNYSIGRWSDQVIDPDNYDQALGRKDRQDEEDRIKRMYPPLGWGNPPTGDGTSSDGVEWRTLFLLVAAGWVIWQLRGSLPESAFAAVILACSSLIAGVLVYVITHVLTPDLTFGYPSARRMSFAGLSQYILLTVMMRVAVGWLRTGADVADLGRKMAGLPHMAIAAVAAFSEAKQLSVFAASPVDQWPAVLGVLLLINGPGTFAFARVLSQRIEGGPYRGVPGFVMASAVAFFTIQMSLSVGAWGCSALWRHSRVLPISANDPLSIVVLYAASVLLPCAIVGGLIGGAVLRSITRSMAHERLGTYRQSYSTAVRALLAYGCPAVLAIFLFRDADTLLSWAAHLTLGVGSHDLRFTRARGAQRPWHCWFFSFPASWRRAQ